MNRRTCGTAVSVGFTCVVVVILLAANLRGEAGAETSADGLFYAEDFEETCLGWDGDERREAAELLNICRGLL